MDKFNSPLANKFKNFEKDSSNSNWAAFNAKRKESTALGDKFTGFEKNSSVAGWDFFEKRKRRKAAIVFWLVKLPLMIGMLAVVYFTNLKRNNPLFENRTETESINLVSNNLENSSNTIEPAVEKSLDIHSSHDESEENDEYRPGENKVLATPSLKANNDELPIEEISLGTPNIEGNFENKTDKNKPNNPAADKMEEETLFGFENENGGKERMLEINNILVSVDRMGLNFIPNPLEKQKALDFNPDFNYKAPSQWSLYLKGGVNYTTSKIVAKPGSKDYTNRDYKEATENAETPAIGYDFQMAAQYRYLENISFKAGLGFSKHRIGGTFNHDIDSVPFIGVRGTILYLPPNKDSLDESSVKGKAGYSYTYLNVPVGVILRKPINNKWHGIVDVSVEMSVLLGAKGSKLNEVYLDEIESFTSNNLRKVNANLNLGLGIMKNVNKDLSLGIMLSGKSYLSPLNNEGFYSSKNTNIGLSLISIYNF